MCKVIFLEDPFSNFGDFHEKVRIGEGAKREKAREKRRGGEGAKGRKGKGRRDGETGGTKGRRDEGMKGRRAEGRIQKTMEEFHG